MAFPIAHRGLSSAFAENSIASVRAALEHVTVVEVDVRYTADGVAVCTHDPSLGRTHGNGLRVAHATLDDVRAAAPDIATLAEILDAVAQAGGAVMLDVKVTRPDAIDAIIADVERSELAWNDGAQLRRGAPIDAGTVTFQSSDPATLQSVRARVGAGTLELVHDHASARELLLTAPFIGAYAQGVTLPSALATRTVVRSLHALRLGTYAYTVNDAREYDRLARIGVRGIYTDVADTFA